MKRILITGEGSYIGRAIEAELRQAAYTVDTVDVRGGAPSVEAFVGYDAVVHVAGIVHAKGTKEEVYMRVNRDLAVTCAERAKEAGVRQLVFFSTMNVYGKTVGRITKDTPPTPRSPYGRSKWEAEQRIGALRSERFAVCILRPPMVYGEGCRGNFRTVESLARRLPAFPRVSNRRSFVFIDHLSAFVRDAIAEVRDGVFFPRDPEPHNTSHMAATVADAYGKRLYLSHVMGWGVCLLRPFVPMVRKAFGTLVYEDMGDGAQLCTRFTNDEAVRRACGVCREQTAERAE